MIKNEIAQIKNVLFLKLHASAQEIFFASNKNRYFFPSSPLPLQHLSFNET